MNHRILDWLGAICVAALLPLLALGQQPNPPGQPPGQQPKTGQPGQPTPGQPTPGQPTPGQPTPGQPKTGQPAQPQPVAERRPPALEYALAMIAALLVLVIVCMPSRKG